MKANSSFPHPVLGVNNSVKSSIAFNDMLEIVEIVENDDAYEYTFMLHQDNKQITNYINEKHAEYICEVDCNKTLYKVSHHFESPRIVVSINKSDVYGRVDFSFYVVTTCAIPKYYNVDFHKDYLDLNTKLMPSFGLKKGDVLVVFPLWNDNVTLRFNNKPDVRSFIQVVKRQDDESVVDIDLNDNVINVELPSEMYVSFCEYNTEQNRGLFYTSLIFNALVKAILNLEKKEGTEWADSIRYMFDSMPAKYSGLSIDEPSDAVDIATRMLSSQDYGTPYDLLFNSISNLQD